MPTTHCGLPVTYLNKIGNARRAEAAAILVTETGTFQSEARRKLRTILIWSADISIGA